MSRSFGKTFFTTLLSMEMGARGDFLQARDSCASRGFPQPEGPTSTMNCDLDFEVDAVDDFGRPSAFFGVDFEPRFSMTTLPYAGRFGFRKSLAVSED